MKNSANVKAENRYGVTPLSLACANGNTDLVELLLNAGADPNTTLRGGEAILMTAARTGKPESVKELLSHGAVVDAPTKICRRWCNFSPTKEPKSRYGIRKINMAGRRY